MKKAVRVARLFGLVAGAAFAQAPANDDPIPVFWAGVGAKVSLCFASSSVAQTLALIIPRDA